MTDLSKIQPPKGSSAVIMLADGTVIWGKGIGAHTQKTGEICFNTAMIGYQEVLTDPSYAGQIITFTFPHIGNTGVNNEDIETINPAARGVILRQDITALSNWRAAKGFDEWLKSHDLPGICGVDTRALTRRIRDHGAPAGVISHSADGHFDLQKLYETARGWEGLQGVDLAAEVSCTQSYQWDETIWDIKNGYGTQTRPTKHIVAVDFGAKRNILRCLAQAGCKVTVVPAQTSAADILAHKPDGIFLSNGPGDPAATGRYAVPMVQKLLESGTPLFGICLGHQILALALGGKTEKMHLGHRGANHPVKDLQTRKVEITSQNHGFQVVPESLPENIEITHTSLFDGSNEGLRVKDKPFFSVQYHPEGSPGPHDSHYLFARFMEMCQ